MSLGRTISALCPVIPGGLLVFFPSYFIMNKCKATWQEEVRCFFNSPPIVDKMIISEWTNNVGETSRSECQFIRINTLHLERNSQKSTENPIVHRKDLRKNTAFAQSIVIIRIFLSK